MQQNIEMFENDSIPKSVAKNVIPSILSMIVVLLYNMADTYFVGQTNDPLQVAAVSITTPVFILLMAVGMLFGIGGTSMISRAFGEGKREKAKTVASFCFYASIAAGIASTVLILVFMNGILSMIGTSADTYALAQSYLSCIALGAPFIIVSNGFSNIVRAEGKASIAMGGVMLGTVINIVLDPIMILYMDMGVQGAALATVIGNIGSVIYYVIYLASKRSMLSISPKQFSMKGGILTGVLMIGIPACFNSLLMSASNIVLNNLLSSYGDIPLAAMGVAMKASMLVVMVLIGFGQGIQPLIGYSYGAGNISRTRGIVKFSIGCVVIIGIMLTSVCLLGSEQIVRAFINDAEVIEYGITFVHALMVSGPVIGVLFVLTNALQGMGAAVPSLILSISRQGFVFIPMIFILNLIFGVSGIVYAQPTADYVSIAIAATLFIREIRLLERINGDNSKEDITLKSKLPEPEKTS